MLKMTGRIPELDGIRGTAIAMVLVEHLFRFPLVPGSLFSRSVIPLRLAWTGVDLFFVLSGFLIGGILLDVRKAPNYFQVFYLRRFFRIVPVYAAVLLIIPALAMTARILHLENYRWLSGNPLPWFSYWTFTQNFWMARTNLSGLMIIAMTWSLAIEEQFYLTLPILIRVLTKKALMTVVVSGIFLAPILRTLILVFTPDNNLACYVLMPCRADALLLGVLVALILRDEKACEVLKRRKLCFGLLFLVLSPGMAYLALRNSFMFDTVMQMIGYTWVALFYATVVLFVLIYRESLLAALFRNRGLRWLGGLAYGVYLIHQTVLGFVLGPVWATPFITNWWKFAAAVGALALTLLIAMVSWRYFELPLVRIGHKFSYHPEERPEEILVEVATL